MTIAPPKIGFGTASIATAPERDARETLEYALENGIRYFDSAPLYGGGQAEQRLGQALKDAPPDMIISTKCGRNRRFGADAPSVTGEADIWDYSETAIRESIQNSCERLGRNYLDIVFLHDIEANPDQAFAEALPVLRELQGQGRIGLVGAGCNSVAGHIAAIEADAADVLLVAGRWTLADRSAGEQLIPLATQQGSRIVVGGVLNSGCLADPRAPDACFNYRPVTADERRTLYKLDDIARENDITLFAAAVQFPGRDARIGTTLLGAANREQLAMNIDGLAVPVPPAFWIAVQDITLSA